MMPGGDTTALLAALTEQLLRHAPVEGGNATVVPGLTLLRLSGPTLVQRGMLKPSVCILAQGEKIGQAGADTPLRYRAGQFLAAAIEMPVAGQVLHASKAKPYLAALFELCPADVLSVLTDAQIQVDATAPSCPATFVGDADGLLLDVVLRAVSSLGDEREAGFFAPLLRRELIYRLVTGPSAFAVAQSALQSRPDDGVGRAVEWIKTNFKEPLVVDALAKHANMSTSSLHHKFKATVLMSPVQYQKRLRLEEARRLLLSGRADATSAASDVGYESPSQFIREYRRLFGMPPMRDVKRTRDEARAASRLTCRIVQQARIIRQERQRAAPYTGSMKTHGYAATAQDEPLAYPVVPGHEIVGRVIEVGSKVTRHAVGDAVAVGTMVDACMTCDQCKKGNEHMCRTTATYTFGAPDRVTGEITKGGYAKHLVVREEFALRVPKGLDLSRAAPLLCAGITVYSPLRTWNVGPGSRVGVVGLGGLGHLAVKFAAALGAEVTLLSRSSDKAAGALDLGADKTLVTTDAGAMAKAASSFDVIIDTVPVKHDLSPYLPLLDVDGTLVVVGQLGPVAELNTYPLIAGRRRIVGSPSGGLAETEGRLALCAKKNILPEVELIQMEQVNEAFARLDKSDVRYRFVIDVTKFGGTA